MSEETTQAPATEAPKAAPDTGGETGARRPMMGRDGDVNPVAAGEPRFKGRRRRKVSFLTINKIDKVDYRDVPLLRRFINDRGKILSTKATGNTAKQQRIVAAAIRKAREMALLPFVVTEFSHDSRPHRPPRRNDYGDRPQYDRNRD